MQNTVETGTPVNFTATATLPGEKRLLGIFVSSSTGGTLTISDDITALSGAIACVAGTFYRFPANFKVSCVLTVGGTLNATAFFA